MSDLLLSPDCTVAPNRHLLVSELGDEMVLLDLDQGLYYGLNAQGAFIWARLEPTPCVGDLLDAILDHFDVEAERAHADLSRLLCEMAERGMVALAPVPSTP